MFIVASVEFELLVSLVSYCSAVKKSLQALFMYIYC